MAEEERARLSGARPGDKAEAKSPLRAAEPPPALERLGRRLLVPVALGVLTCLVLALVGDVQELRSRLREFDLGLLVPVLALSLVNYGLRLWRWQIYLGSLGVELPLARSAEVFLVGFVLSVTPGKAGELGKAWLVRELGGGPARRVVPAVLAERLTDLLGVLWLVSLGALGLPSGWWIVMAGVALGLVILGLLSWQGAARWLLGRLETLPLVGRGAGILGEVYTLLLTLLRPGVLLSSIALAVVAWGAEGVGFVLVVEEYAPEVGFLTAIFDYSLSTLVGGLSMLPGGLLASEGALTALLDAQGLPLAAAASATLIIRAATLWFAIFLGLLALPRVWRRLAQRAP